MSDPCCCGCGESVNPGKAFVQGHDGRLTRKIKLVLDVESTFGAVLGVYWLRGTFPMVAYTKLGECPVCGMPNVRNHGNPRHDR